MAYDVDIYIVVGSYPNLEYIRTWYAVEIAMDVDESKREDISLHADTGTRSFIT
jgi:hypothetical protein